MCLYLVQAPWRKFGAGKRNPATVCCTYSVFNQYYWMNRWIDEWTLLQGICTLSIKCTVWISTCILPARLQNFWESIPKILWCLSSFKSRSWDKNLRGMILLKKCGACWHWQHLLQLSGHQTCLSEHTNLLHHHFRSPVHYRIPNLRKFWYVVQIKSVLEFR